MKRQANAAAGSSSHDTAEGQTPSKKQKPSTSNRPGRGRGASASSGPRGGSGGTPQGVSEGLQRAQDSDYKAVTIRALAIMGLPVDFGTHASIYLCKALTPATASRSVDDDEIDEAKTLLKIHRQSLPGHDTHPAAWKWAPSLLERDLEDACASGESVNAEEREQAATELARVKADVLARTDNELAAYEKLGPLQGTVIPKLVGTVSATMNPRSYAPKLVLERTGTTLSCLAEHCSDIYAVWLADIEAATIGAVEACHRHNVIHCDIHAANILVEWLEADKLGGESEAANLAMQRQTARGRLQRGSAAHRARQRPSSTSLWTDPGVAYPYAPRGREVTEIRPRLVVRVSLIDWSHSALDASEEEKREELKLVRQLLADLRRWATGS